MSPEALLAQGFSVTCRLGSGPLLLPEAGGRELWPGGRREHPLRQDGEGRSGRRRLGAGGTPNSPFPPPLFHPPLRPVPVTLFILFVGLGHFCFRFYIPHGSEITSVSTFPDLFHAARSSQDPSALLQCQRPAVPAAEQRSAARRKGGGDSPPSTRQQASWGPAERSPAGSLPWGPTAATPGRAGSLAMPAWEATAGGGCGPELFCPRTAGVAWPKAPEQLGVAGRSEQCPEA